MNALELCQKLLALSILLQTVELLAFKREWSDRGIWSWRTLAHDYDSSSALKMVLTALLNERSFLVLLVGRLAAAAITLVLHANVWALGALFFSSWLISIRWRGTLNGGSDSMTLVVALSVWIAELNRDQPAITKIALGYIAVQLTASYWIAGLAKLCSPSWRNGSALAAFFETPGYDSPPAWVKSFFTKPSVLTKAAVFSIILFECAFPVAWLDSGACAIFLGLAIVFHLMNFFVFGLNRFVFAWIAAYPALWFWSERILERSRH